MKNNQYEVTYEYKISGIELFISEDTSFGISIDKIYQDLPEIYEYNNKYGEILLFTTEWGKPKTSKFGVTKIKELSGTVKITFPHKFGSEYDGWKYGSYLECFMQLLFFIFNVYYPGLFDIGEGKYTIANINILKDKKDESIYPGDTTMERKGNFGLLWDDRFSEMVDQKTIVFNSDMSLIKIYEWTKNYGWFNQLSSSSNRLESAIFGLFHLFLNKRLAEETLIEVIYITKTIEAMYDAPNSGIGKTITSRIKLLLNIDLENAKKLTKIFYKFYDLRSKVVHGDYFVNNTILFDNFCDDKEGIGLIWDDIRNKDIHIMYALIFKTFQEIINRGISKIEFEEKLIIDQ